MNLRPTCKNGEPPERRDAMARTIAIGRQDFEKIRVNHNFYIDKTDFIRQWWESEAFRKNASANTVLLSVGKKY